MLENVPVNIANMDHLAYITGEQYKISSVIGTGVFKQFLVTMDYLNEELLLKPRGEHLPADAASYEVPFIMAETHYTFCKAKVNGKEINMWTDSGLADEESLLLSDGAMEYIGIDPPERAKESEDRGGGLGGNDFPVGRFTADTFEMGSLPVSYDLRGLMGILPGSGYEVEGQCFLDGIISNNYLKNYKWTIDYDLMKITFSQ